MALSDGGKKPLTRETGIAVIIVNFNAGNLLEKCIRAVQCQREVSPRRVIVVDNASSDGSADAIEAAYPNVQVIHCPENYGFAKGNNLGISAADDCEWIACLNPDAFPEPDWLECLMGGAFAHPESQFFGCKLLQDEDPKRLDGTGDVYHISGLAWRRDHGKLETEGVETAGEIFGPCAAAALYRRDALLEVGGFDEGFFCYFEDVDLAFRLRLKGHRCCYLPDAKVRHVGSAITGRRSKFAVYHGHRNLVWTYLKNMPMPLLLLYLPLHLALNLVSVIIYVWRVKQPKSLEQSATRFADWA